MGGIRVEFELTPGLTVGLSRGLQQCGAGRPRKAGIFARALIGLLNQDNSGTLDEPGNQLAGFDLQFRFPIGRGGDAASAYFEAVAESEDNIVIEPFARLGGIRLTGPVGAIGARYTHGFELGDTRASTFPGSMSNHLIHTEFIYTDGWTDGRRPIGHPLDGDTRMFSVSGSLIDLRNRFWSASFRLIDLNVSALLHGGGRTNRVLRTRERIRLGTAGVEWPTRIGDLRFEARPERRARHARPVVVRNPGEIA